MKRRALALAFGFGVALAILGISEGLLRHFEAKPGYLQPDRLTRWALRPGFQGRGPDMPDVPLSYDVRVNGAGFRGGATSPAKPAGVLRFVTLGDSVTFGVGVPEEAALAARVAALLTADVAPRKMEWINAGVPGFSSLQGLRYFEQRVLASAPDLVTVLFGWNDGWRGEMPDAQRPVIGRLEDLAQSSRLLTLARKKFDGLMRRVGVQQRGQSSVRVPRVPPDDFEANLLKIGEAVRRAGGIPVFLTPPAAFGADRPPDSYFRYGWMVPRSELEATRQRYAEATRHAAQAGNILLVDCATLVPSDPGLFLADGYHPNQAGFELMAQRVAEAVRQAHVLPRQP